MKRGFTLVEMIVSLMIFSIVVVVALAALVKIIDANKKAQTIHDAVANLSYTLEAMTREVRTGSYLYCAVLASGADLSVPGNQLSSQQVASCNGHNGASGQGVGLAFNTNKKGVSCNLMNAYEIVPVAVGRFVLKKGTQAACGDPLLFETIVDESIIHIEDYYFHIDNDDFPLVFMKLSGIAGQTGNAVTHFSLETAASPRLP